MTHRLIALAACAPLALAASVAFAQTEEGPGGYVYVHESPSIMLVKPEDWTPPEPKVKEPEQLPPIMATDLYEDEYLQQAEKLDDVIGVPRENALGPVLAEQRAEERAAQRLAAEKEREEKARTLAETPAPPPDGIDAQTTAALPDESDETISTTGADVSVEQGVEIIRGDAGAPQAASEQTTDAAPEEMASDASAESGPAETTVIVKTPMANEPADSAAIAADDASRDGASPDFSGMTMRK